MDAATDLLPYPWPWVTGALGMRAEAERRHETLHYTLAKLNLLFFVCLFRLEKCNCKSIQYLCASSCVPHGKSWLSRGARIYSWLALSLTRSPSLEDHLVSVLLSIWLESKTLQSAAKAHLRYRPLSTQKRWAWTWEESPSVGWRMKCSSVFLFSRKYLCLAWFHNKLFP